MKRKALIAAAVLAWFYFIWPTPYLYMGVKTRMNRFTGEVQVRSGQNWHKDRGYSALP